ncbi:MAG TPA: hypothetical protein VGD60_07030 [Candidatus Acidoferrales bacterium]
MKRKNLRMTLLSALALAAVIAPRPVAAQTATPTQESKDAKQPYPTMAPLEQYLMERDAEIALARSAAPDAIAHDATILVLTRRGYETAVAGKNGWVCLVDRAWGGMFDNPEFWNPKVRAAGCLNPPAARSVLPLDTKRTELVLAGRSKAEIVAAMATALEKKEFPALEPGTVCYMMGKASYLTDQGGHNMPHLMFYDAVKEPVAWGANVENSPMMGVNFWSMAPDAYPQLKNFPPLVVFLVGVEKWSDGTPAPSMGM